MRGFGVLVGGCSMLLLSGVAGCGESDAAEPAACPPGAAVNDLFQCLCDNGPNGLTQCQADSTLTGCDCGPEAQNYAAMMNDPMVVTPAAPPAVPPAAPPALPPATPAVPDAGAMPGDGDGDMTAGDGDGDMTAGDGDGDNTTTPGDGDGDNTTTPGEGDQLAACSANTDCNTGLSCYNPVDSGGFCSTTCTDEPDCTSLGGSYTCYVALGESSGACRIECTGASDTSCPSPLTCQNVGGGGMSLFRCLR